MATIKLEILLDSNSDAAILEKLSNAFTNGVDRQSISQPDLRAAYADLQQTIERAKKPRKEKVVEEAPAAPATESAEKQPLGSTGKPLTTIIPEEPSATNSEAPADESFDAAPAPTVITRDDIRAVCRDKSKQGLNAEVNATIRLYAPNLDKVEEKYFVSLRDALLALKKEN